MKTSVENSSQGRTSRSVDSVVFAAFLCLLALLPLYYGGVGYVPQGLTTSLGAILAIVVAIAKRDNFALPMRLLAAPAAAYVAVVAWTLIQALMPAGSLAHPAWRIASDTLQLEISGRISVSPAKTLLGASDLMGYGAFFWIALQLGRSADRAASALGAFASIGAFYAAWGLMDSAFHWDRILFEAKDMYALDTLGGFVTGTFRNRDHFAAYCAIALFCAFSSVLRRGSRLVAAAGIGEVEGRDAFRLVYFLVVAAVLAAAIWMTRSRSVGALTLLAGLYVIGVASWRAARRGRRAFAVIAFLLAGFGALTLVILALSAPEIAERYMKLGGALDDKLVVYRRVLVAVFDYPLIGTGAGAFQEAFPPYRTGEMGYGGVWNAAHNIYLEALLGLGIPVALLLFGAVGWSVWRSFRGAVARRHQAAAPLAASAAAIVLLAHGLFDFSVYTPAVGFAFAALLGFGCAQSFTHAERRRWNITEANDLTAPNGPKAGMR